VNRNAVPPLQDASHPIAPWLPYASSSLGLFGSQVHCGPCICLLNSCRKWNHFGDPCARDRPGFHGLKPSQQLYPNVGRRALVSESDAPPGRGFISRRGKIWVVATLATAAVTIVAATSPLWWVTLERPSDQDSHPGSVTGLQALDLVESLLHDRSSVSWEIFSDLGIAAHSSFTPWVVGSGSSANNSSVAMWACGSLGIVSVWNVSALPNRTGDLYDGFAPFWQFMFVNESGPGEFVFAIGTYDHGSVEAVLPLPETNPCIVALGLGSLTSLPPLAQPNLDTNVAGPLAFSYLQAPVSRLGLYAVLWTDGWVVVYNNGWGSYEYQYGASWGSDFYECGITGYSPTANSTVLVSAAEETQNGTPTVGLGLTTQGNCTLSEYNVSTKIGQNSARGSGYYVNLTLTVEGFALGKFVNDLPGLAAWTLHPDISLSNGSTEPVATDLCTGWTASPASCPPPTKGWYAVLTSPTGGWIDSFGFVNGSAEWVAPNPPLFSNETLTVVSSDLLMGSGDTLTLAPTIAWPQILSSSTPL
jgi:hypothetical protein